MITRQELEAELEEFLKLFAESIDRIYGRGLGQPLQNSVRESTLWNAVMRMYHYGVEGRTSEGLGQGDGSLNPEAEDAKLFLTGLQGLELFLDEDGGFVPRRAVRVVEMACIRHVLDGGDRFHMLDEDGQWSDYLSVSEVALLADMDVKSVRNATNEKAADRLMTETIGKRSVVPLEEAKRWLAGRKGFRPTVKSNEGWKPAPAAQLLLSCAASDLLRSRAEADGVDVETFILNTLGKEVAA